MLASARSSGTQLVFAWCGAAVFALSLLVFLYSYFVRFGVPTDDRRSVLPIVVDVLLFSVFALHHSILARPSAKDRLRTIVPAALERSVYTWTASLLFILVCTLWQPVPGALYRLPGNTAWLGYAVQLLGIVVIARSSARLDVLDLAGVRSARHGVGEPEHVPLETRGLYRFVRHPLYFGWVLIVFGAPYMTMTRLTFAAVSTVYLVIAIPIEERSLVQTFGTDYRTYQNRVRWRMLPGVY